MASLLMELLHDASQRAGDIAAALNAVSINASPAVDAYRNRMAAMGDQARSVIDRMLVDPDIDDPVYANNYFRDYSYFARLIRGLEDLPLLVLERFNAADQQATDFMTAICSESRYPFTPPICSALSSQYFWTRPDMDLVFVPCLEPNHLLGIPDIYHELGHILLFREKVRLEQGALAIVDDEFAGRLGEGKRQNWPAASLEQIEAYHHNWRRSWLLEFGSDLIATYLVGPSFGWCNIRTATNLGGALFEGNDSHPADDARATAIGMMLSEIGYDDSRMQIQYRWKELVDLANESAPHRYELAYPMTLLKSLTRFFREQCNDMGLAQFDRAAADLPMAVTIDKCWAEFRNKPGDYADFERSQLAGLLSVIRT